VTFDSEWTTRGKVVRQNWFDSLPVQIILKILLWGYVFCAVMSFFAVPVSKFDDAIVLVDAMLVEQRFTPNLDFFSYYPPLGHYVNAAAFHFLGDTVLAVRAIGAVLYVLVLLSAGQLSRSKSPQLQSLVPMAMLFLAASIGNAISLPSWPGFAVSMMALLTYIYAQGGTRDRLWLVAASGGFAGAALLYRINFGAYVAVVVGLDQLLQWCRRGGAHWIGRPVGEHLLRAATFWGSLAICCVGFCLWVYGRHTVTVVPNLVTSGQGLVTARFNDLPFTLRLVSMLVLPPLWFFGRILTAVHPPPVKAFAPLAAAVCVISVVRFGHAHAFVVPVVVAIEIGTVILLHLFIYHLERFELMGLLFFCSLLHYYLSRTDYPHGRLLLISAALLLLLFIFSANGAIESEPGSVSKRGALAVLMTATVVCLASIEFRPVAVYIPNGVRLVASLGRHPRTSDGDRVLGGDVPEAVWLSIYPDQDELRALRYLRARTSIADTIFVGIPVNSKIDRNSMDDLRIYWLAGRKIGVRMFELEPGMMTKLVTQRELIADLELNNVKWVVIDSASSSPDPQADTGFRLLDQYLATRYRQEAQFGSYSILYDAEASQPVGK
jgi:hypothetical protein